MEMYMGKYSGILICSDFDGTLAHKAQIPQRNIDAIKYFCENGGLFSVITGRSFDFLLKYEDSLCMNTYVGCVNGTTVYHFPTRKLISEKFVDGDISERMGKIVQGLDNISDTYVFGRNGNVYIPHDSPDFSKKLRQELDRSVYKVLIHGVTPFTEEEMTFVRNALGDGYTAARSWETGIEIQNSSYHKGVAARRIAELAGAERLVCVGDYENDIPMIQEADVGYAVANALPSVKAIADKLTLDVRDGAIAAIIDEL